MAAAAAPVAIYRGANVRTPLVGGSIMAIAAPFLGAVITNPITAASQGLPFAEPLYVDMVETAGLQATGTTTILWPGDSIELPAGDTQPVSVNAKSGGHRFSAVMWQTPTQFPPTPIPSSFPPSGPTGLTKIIPSYVYVQYNDDDDVQAFAASYNSMAQDVLDTLINLNLPIYTSDPVSGELLDWVATGLYGMPRPSLSSGKNSDIGPFNTYEFNTLPFNVIKIVTPGDVVFTSDDIFRRILTWALYKGDGKVFNIRWLKRRVMRFLIGDNGSSPNIDQTYRISVTFGTGNQVTIGITSGIRTVLGGAIFGEFAFNSMPFDSLISTFEAFPPLANTLELEEGIASGALELPFQFNWNVNVGG